MKTKVFYSDIPLKFKPLLKQISKIHKVDPPLEFYNRKKKNQSEEIQFAIPVKVNIDFMKESFVDESEGILTYSLMLEADDALNLSLQFSKFNLTEGAILSIYTQNELTDSITSSQNNENNVWATRVYQGNKLSIVLKIPRDSKEKVYLKIGAVNLGYKKFGVQFDYGNIGSSANCHINANCPAGNNWNDEKNSVAMIVANGIIECTGSLIMNTCNTKTPYFLTASHCLGAGNVPNWVFQFQTLSTDCATNTGWREDVQFNGCILRANNGATDFALLELNTPPPSNSGLFYSGWSRQTTGNTSTTVLHHPAGDLMKISADNQAPTSLTSLNVDVWQIDQDLGRLQGGSSGAPYYNQNHQIIGQHWRRPEVNTRPICDITIAQGGRFDRSWTGGGTNATRLSNWLDPSNSGAMTTNTTNVSNLILTPGTGLAISGNEEFCNSGVYTLNVPTGVSVTWSISNPYAATLSPSGNQVTITKIYDSKVTLSATICGSAITVTKDIFIGVTGVDMISFINGAGGEGYFCTSHYGNKFIANTGRPNTGIEYRVRDWPNLNIVYTDPTIYAPGEVPMNYMPSTLGYYVVEVRVHTNCGITDWMGYEVEFTNCIDGGGGLMGEFAIMASPNPTDGDLHIKLIKEKPEVAALSKTENIRMVLTEMSTQKTMKQWTFKNDTNQFKLDVRGIKPGLYILNVYKGKYKQSKQILIK